MQLTTSTIALTRDCSRERQRSGSARMARSVESERTETFAQKFCPKKSSSDTGIIPSQLTRPLFDNMVFVDRAKR